MNAIATGLLAAIARIPVSTRIRTFWIHIISPIGSREARLCGVRAPS